MTSFTEYVQQADELPPEVVLGHMVLYTIYDEPVSEAELEEWFKELGLDQRLLPTPLRAVDAYRKATTKADGFNYPLRDGTYATILTRDVSNNPDRIVRELVREVRNGKKVRLSFGTAIRAVFYRPQSDPDGKLRPGSERFHLEVQHHQLLTEERERMQGLIDQIRVNYKRYCDFHDGNKLRGVVRDYLLKRLGAIEIKSGTYFVHRHHADELKRLAELIDRFGGQCRMHRIPIPALVEMREMVIEAFRRESKEKMDDLVKEIIEVQGRRSITVTKWASLKQRYDVLQRRVDEHCKVLETDAADTTSAAELALETLEIIQSTMLEGQ